MSLKKRKEDRKRKVSAKRYAEQSQQGDYERTTYRLPANIPAFKIEKEGSINIDILPSVAKDNPRVDEADLGELWFERTFYIHRNMGPDGRDSYVCEAYERPKKSGRANRCYVCEHRNELRRKDAELYKEEIAALSPKRRQLWYVYDRKNTAAGVQLWEVSYSNFGSALAEELNNDEENEYEFFSDPEEGLTVRARMKKSSFRGTTFYEASSVSFKPRLKPLSSKLHAKLPSLDDLVIHTPYGKLRDIFIAAGPVDDDDDDDDDDLDDDDDDDDDDTPKKSKKAPKKSKKVDDDDDLDDDDDDDDDEDDDDLDDDDDTLKKSKKAPPKKAPPKKSKKVDDDDDLDDDDDDDDDDLDDDDDDDDDDLDDDDDDDDDDTPKKSKKAPKKSKKAPPKKSKKVDDDDDDDDDDDLDDVPF
jgi:hypothetical protein